MYTNQVQAVFIHVLFSSRSGFSWLGILSVGQDMIEDQAQGEYICGTGLVDVT